MLGLVWSMPAFVTWIPETLGTILMLTGVMTQEQRSETAVRPGLRQVFAQAHWFVALGWYLLLFRLAVALTQKVHW